MLKLKGHKTVFNEGEFPFTKRISVTSIKETIHFTFPTSFLLENARTLSDIRQDSIEGTVYLAGIGFIAEALKNVLIYRGSNRCNAFSDNWKPRATVVMTYIPKRLNESEIEPFSSDIPESVMEDELLFTGRNIVAIVFTVMIHDPEINFGDAFSDQIDISTYGLPKVREDQDLEKYFARIAARNRDPDGAGAGAGAGMGDGNTTERQTITHTRLDEEGVPLTKSGYKFSRVGSLPNASVNLRPVKSIAKLPTKSHYKKITTINAYIKLVLQRGGNISDTMSITECLTNAVAESFRVSNIEKDSPVHYLEALSLETMIERIRELGAHPLFCKHKSWIKNIDQSIQGGIPSDHLYQIFPLEGTCSAQIQIKNFNDLSLNHICLPHISIFDKTLLRPKSNLTKNTMVGPEGSQYSLEEFCASIGLVTSLEQKLINESKNKHEDIFNEYFRNFAEHATRLESMFDRSALDNKGTILRRQDEKYIEYYKRLKEQGIHIHESPDPKLPKAFEALNDYVDLVNDWVPKIINFWNTGKHALDPYAQLKVSELLVFENLSGVTSNTLFAFPILLRCFASVALPKMGTNNNKLNFQMEGPPGTSKSELIEAACKLMIDGTYVRQGGSSDMASLGEMSSQRLVEVFHELTGSIAPDSDPRGAAAKLFAIRLTQLTEALYVYVTTTENPEKKGSRIVVRNEAEFTNVIVGAMNPQKTDFRKNGKCEAMLDRFQKTQIRVMGNDSDRKRAIRSVLCSDSRNADYKILEQRTAEQYKLLQRCKMDYCSFMARYAAPVPDLMLFSKISPMAIHALATLRPEIYSKFRRIKDIKTKMYAESIDYAAKLAVCSILNPNVVVKDDMFGNGLDDTPVFSLSKEYNTRDVVEEMGKYAYSTMPMIVFIMSESIAQLISSESYAMLNGIARESANYIALGEGIEKDDKRSMRKWPEQEEESTFFSRMSFVSQNSTLRQFLTAMNSGEMTTKDFLGIPTRDTGSKSFEKSSHYISYALTPIDTEIPTKTIMQDGESSVDIKNLILDRPIMPKYKKEKVDGVTYLNFNYVRIQGTVRNYARSCSRTFGNCTYDEQSLTDLIYYLTNETMLAPYVPLIREQSPITLTHYAKIQSLRHNPDVVKSWSVYRLPVLIVDNVNPEGHCFYILVSAIESNPRNIIDDMIDKWRYHSSREFHSVLGIPSTVNPNIYEEITFKSKPGKKLIIQSDEKQTSKKLDILQTHTNMTLNGMREQQEIYFMEDIEHVFAKRHLARHYPNLSDREAHAYTPTGINERLFGSTGLMNIPGVNSNTERYPEQFITTPLPKKTSVFPVCESLEDVPFDNVVASISQDSSDSDSESLESDDFGTPDWDNMGFATLSNEKTSTKNTSTTVGVRKGSFSSIFNDSGPLKRRKKS